MYQSGKCADDYQVIKGQEEHTVTARREGNLARNGQVCNLGKAGCACSFLHVQQLSFDLDLVNC